MNTSDISHVWKQIARCKFVTGKKQNKGVWINTRNFSHPPEIPDIVTFPGFLHVLFSTIAISQTGRKTKKKRDGVTQWSYQVALSARIIEIYSRQVEAHGSKTTQSSWLNRCLDTEVVAQYSGTGMQERRETTAVQIAARKAFAVGYAVLGRRGGVWQGFKKIVLAEDVVMHGMVFWARICKDYHK